MSVPTCQLTSPLIQGPVAATCSAARTISTVVNVTTTADANLGLGQFEKGGDG